MTVKEIIRIDKTDLKKPRRSWSRKPQTQVLPRKTRASRKKEKQTIQEKWRSGNLE
ncbi:MAG: hypothetical protein LAO31_12270 [Acidobacteriia bacterium]|nr:hypothetical protein [Terriglobia bacterium]